MQILYFFTQTDPRERRTVQSGRISDCMCLYTSGFKPCTNSLFLENGDSDGLAGATSWRVSPPAQLVLVKISTGSVDGLCATVLLWLRVYRRLLQCDQVEVRGVICLLRSKDQPRSCYLEWLPQSDRLSVTNYCKMPHLLSSFVCLNKNKIKM